MPYDALLRPIFPVSVITCEGALTPAQIAAIRSAFEDGFSGRKPGRLVVVPSDLAHLKTKTFPAALVCKP